MRVFQNLRVPAHSATSVYFVAGARRSAQLLQSHSPKDLNLRARESVVSKLPHSVGLYLYPVDPWFAVEHYSMSYLWGCYFGHRFNQQYLVGKCCQIYRPPKPLNS